MTLLHDAAVPADHVPAAHGDGQATVDPAGPEQPALIGTHTPGPARYVPAGHEEHAVAPAEE